MSAAHYVFPASFAQQRLWFLDQLEGASAVYNLKMALRLSGPLDLDGLQRAVDAVVARHESLRTSFARRGTEVVQRVASELQVPVQQLVLCDAGKEALASRLNELASASFDLQQGPLLRVHLLRLDAEATEHALLLVMHHIVSDAWSAGVLYRDLAACYSAFRRGTVARLPELPVQYADFAVWQRDWLAGAELEQQMAFWRDHLQGAPPLLELPVDRPRPAVQSYRGNRLGRTLPASLSARLQALAAAEGVTLYMLLFAAFNLLLARWSGQSDLVLGTPIAGRRRSELEALIGCFANTLAIRTQIDGVGSFRELLARVKTAALGAFAHQELPFEKLVEVLKPPRSLAHSPLFQVMFILQNTPWEAVEFGGLAVEPADMAAADTAKFELTVSVAEFESQLWLALEYNSDLFDADTIERLGAGFETLLAAIVADPAAALSALPVQADKDRQRLIAAADDTAAPFDRHRGIWSLFAGQVAQRPDAVAVEADGRALDYAQLERRAGQLAAALHVRGARPGQAVAICLERGIDMLAGMLAVLRLGAHYVPLDPAHPAARLLFILEDSNAGLLLATRALAVRLSGFRGTVLDPAAVSEADVPDGLPAVAALPVDGLAYLIYTSGSTGQPKGVRVPQRAVLNFLHAMARTPGLTADDRLLAVTTPAFDIAVLELLLPLVTGACTVIATRDELADPPLLIRRLADARISVMQATPALWRNLLTAGWAGQPGLRMLCGGEALDAELAAALLARGAELWNMYGPTETTVWSCCGRVTAASAAPIPVGRPIANTRCHVLDERQQPVPRGVRGELWIGGEGVACGYHGRPALTAGRFCTDPFVQAAAGGEAPPRMYRTGDRARWRSDGQLEILGRSDFQLKLRGFRIEPGEIEAALLSHSAVGAAVVVLREFAGDPRLVAFMVSAAGGPKGEAGTEQLRAHLRERLPDYMLPAEFVWLPGLPLNPNGKIDRAALPAVPRAALGEARDDAPASPLETLLCALFADVLGRGPVGASEDFFALGGHSLLATQLIARIRDALQVELPLKTLFMRPTPAGIAASLPGAPVVPQAAPQPSPAAHALAPLSPVQQRMWFLDRLQPGSPVYNLVWTFRLRGVLDLKVLQAAVDALVARHAVLRTRFVESDGEPRQAIAETLAVPVNVLGAELPGSAGGAWEARLKTCLQLLRFDLARGPLLQVFVLPVAGHDQVLSIVAHHIVADGWSFGILGRELSVLYNAAVAGETATLPALPLQYADYAIRQRAALDGGELERQLAFWRAQLEDAPPFLDLPADRPRPALSTHRGARCQRLLGPELQSALKSLAQAEGCTLFMVLLAAFDVLLARYAGSEDIVVGTPVAGRPRTELEGLIGFFVNTLVLRADLRGNPRFGELLQRVKHGTLDAWAHADVPFEQLVELLQPPRSTGRSPLFQVLFNLHNEPGGRLELSGLEVTPLAVDRGMAKFDLSVSLSESASGLAVSFEYSTDLFLAASMQRMLDDFAALLGTVVARPDAPLASLCIGQAPPLRPDLPQIALLRQAGEGTLAAGFAAQRQQHAGATAVAASAVAGFSGVEWSYAALDQRARAVAAALLQRGVTRGACVGLWFNQGAGQIAALLGVLQAGAAYVPLDPLAPAARLEAVVRDAGLRVVVSDRQALDSPAGTWPRQSGLELILLDELAAAPDLSTTLPAGSPDDPAYLLYTSGTTGTPKRVAQTQRGVLHYVQSWAANLGLTPADRLSLVSTYGYDAAVQDIFGALLSGAAVHPLDIRRLDRETLLDRIAAAGLSVLHATPTVYRHLFGSHVACRQDLSRVRLIVLGGEAARRADFELFKARFRRGARFVNGYGLTEATAVLQGFSDHDTQPYGNVLSLGWPVGDQRVLLLDAQGQPAGVSGELVIESRHVPGGRLHTGDLARYLPDGSLAWLGRCDDQLKLGGIRIEPGEIEAALRTHPALAAVAVILHADAASEPMLVAWCSLRTGASLPSPAALRAHLRPLLPDALQPARYVQVESLPQLPNGKVDRRALASRPLPRPMASGNGSSAVAEGSIELLLTELWQVLLKRDDVGPEDDFFALGGHSLLATRLIARLRDRLGIELPLISIFETPTIRGLAAAVVRLTERSDSAAVPAAIGRQARPPLP
ncbi:MAG: amino acid adenylation domain-containing protein [Gammaproteobacteria bacterium]